MKLVSIEQVKTTEYLARPVLDSQGRVFLPEGVKLTGEHLQRLRELEVEAVYVKEDETPVEADRLGPQEFRKQVLQATKEDLLGVKVGNSQGHKRIQWVVNEIIANIQRNEVLVDRLADLRSIGDHTFTHSINVCILSIMTGIKMGYDDWQLAELGTGALLHDIGKLVLPEETVNSPKVFINEDYQIIQKHCKLGFEILNKAENANSAVAQVALQHHERYNGTGYPRGLAGGDIHEYARIVAIADVYDALSGDRPYRKRAKTFEVVEMIRDNRGSEFDPDITDIFISNIAVFPVGSLVTLNTGFKGMVVSVEKEFPARPRVRLLYDKEGRRVDGMKFADLMRELTLCVTDVEE